MQHPGPKDPEQLRLLRSWTKPAPVVEIWQRRRKNAENYTVVGEPLLLSQLGMNLKPILFDPVTQRTAHCLSANVLTPGKDYPVGEAIPHPLAADVFYYMIYLPTPRCAWCGCTGPPSPMSRNGWPTSADGRSPECWPNGRRLTEAEAQMLAVLDPSEVSRFAGKYFLLVNDSPADPLPVHVVNPDEETWLHLGGRPGHFGTICVWVAVDGTKDAVPGLLEAMAKKRFLPPTPLRSVRPAPAGPAEPGHARSLAGD